MLYYSRPNVPLLPFECGITSIRIAWYFACNLILLLPGDSINSTAILGYFAWILIELPGQSTLTFPVLCFVFVMWLPEGRLAEAWNTFLSSEVFPRLLQLLLGLVPGFLP